MKFEADAERASAGTGCARVVLVDPHHLVRLELSRLIDQDQNLEVVAQARSAADTRSVMAEHSVDIIVIARALPDGDGFELCRELCSDRPGIRCVIHSAGEIESADLTRSGATAVVLKQLSGDDLIRTLRDLAISHFQDPH